jgi:hypothetical protein
MDIIKCNKKIAIYMGYVEDGNNITHPEFGTLTEKGLRLLKYHESYSELMPVVDKINKRDFVTIYSDECKIHVVDTNETIFSSNEGESMLISIYESVVKYIDIINNLK